MRDGASFKDMNPKSLTVLREKLLVIKQPLFKSNESMLMAGLKMNLEYTDL